MLVNKLLILKERPMCKFSNIALRAWKKIPDVEDPSASFSAVQQGLTEGLCPLWIGQKKLLDIRQYQEATEILLKQMAYENANQDCKNVLKPLVSKPEATKAEIIRLCQTIGVGTYEITLLAAALTLPS